MTTMWPARDRQQSETNAIRGRTLFTKGDRASDVWGSNLFNPCAHEEAPKDTKRACFFCAFLCPPEAEKPLWPLLPSEAPNRHTSVAITERSDINQMHENRSVFCDFLCPLVAIAPGPSLRSIKLL